MFIYYYIGEFNAWAGVVIALAIIAAIVAVLIVKIIFSYESYRVDKNASNNSVDRLLDEIKETRKNANILMPMQNSDCCKNHCKTINININFNNENVDGPTKESLEKNESVDEPLKENSNNNENP